MKKILIIALVVATVPVGLSQASITVGEGIGYDFEIIQAGIDSAIDGDIVLVAPGEYIITEPITFLGKAITVKSEAGPEETTIRMSTPVDPNRGSVVLFENNETVESILDGFTITGGQGCAIWTFLSSGSAFLWVGGGILINNCSGAVKNCVIVQNNTMGGGGVCCIENAYMTITDCIIAENSATSAGGGVFCGESSSISITNCVIENNKAGLGGGGLEVWRQGSATVINCVIVQNRVLQGGGGGMICAPYGYPNCFAIVKNSIFWENSATDEGPEIWVRGGATLDITYSNVVGGQDRISIKDDTEDGILNWDVGNIDANPHFVRPGYWADINDPNIVVESNDPNAIWIIGDYHLKSEAGRWISMNSIEQDPNSDNWVFDDITSPCIDRGDPNMSVGDEPIPNGDIINMGAYGGTKEASMSIGYPTPLTLAHWKLDETEGMFAADTTGDNDAFVIGSCVWLPDGGQVNGALQLDGASGYAITGFALNPANGPFSIIAWIKGDVPGQVIISQQATANWLATDAEGNLMTELKSSDPLAGPLFSESIITDGQWHRVGLVWNGSHRTLYVDGAAVAEDTQPGLESSQMGLYIGVDKNYAPGTFFSGQIDDVRICNEALIQEQIEALSQ